ncbi:MAG: GNAT family N-acetyltransferase [Actinomycetota bacterium]
MSDIEVRFIEEAELRQYRDAIVRGFGADPGEMTAEELERYGTVNVTETSIVAVDHGRFVATFGSYDLEVTVPGGHTLDVAGTTHVTVHPTHRRLGLLRRMMEMHVEQAAERNQPAAALWASEETIYGRFGYGPACLGVSISVPERSVTISPPPAGGSLRSIDADDARRIFPEVYRRVLPTQPGLFARSEGWWEQRFFSDPKDRREGATALRYVVAERNGEPVGYVMYRQREPGQVATMTGPARDGSVVIQEIISVDDDARQALWSFALNVDLYRNVEWWNAPVDEPILVDADRFRTLGRTTIDTMWFRVLDVAECLTGRSYERDGTLVIEVIDPSLDRTSTVELVVSDGRAACTATDAAPDVSLDVAELSALYLGGRSAVQLARAGRIAGSEAAVATLDELMRTRRAPHCIEVF